MPGYKRKLFMGVNTPSKRQRGTPRGGVGPTRRVSRNPFNTRRISPYLSVRGARTTTVVRSAGPVPQRAIVKMKYVEDNLTGNGSTIDYLWNMNSTFDPNLTGTGHQPYGRDTYAALYNRYRVFAFAYRIEVTSGSTGGLRIVTVPNNSTSTFTNYTLASESPYAVTKVMQAGWPATLTGRVNLPRLNGVLPSVYKSDDRYQAVSGATPTEDLIFHTVVCGADGTAQSANSYFMRVQFTYYVEWFDPVQLGQS